MRLVDAMDEVMIRVLQGRATPQEEGMLRGWRQATDGGETNERRFRRIRELWALTAAAAPDFSPFGRASSASGGIASQEHAPALEEILSRAEVLGPSLADRSSGPPAGRLSVMTDDEGGARTRRGRGSRGGLLRKVGVVGLAAGIAAVGFGIGVWSVGGVGGDAGAVTSHMEVKTGPGEMTTVMLGDGTAIRVGGESKLRVSEGTGSDREVWLEGRAFFGVDASDSSVFTVRTAYGEAVALGTRFEVRTEGEEFRVLVVEGNVRVSASGAEVEVGEGVMSRSPGGEPPQTVAVEDMEAYLSWMGPTLVFRGTTLQRAIGEIERRYGVQVEVTDPELLDLTVTATFTVLPVERVISVICEIVGAECEIQGNRIRIDPGIRSNPVRS